MTYQHCSVQTRRHCIPLQVWWTGNHGLSLPELTLLGAAYRSRTLDINIALKRLPSKRWSLSLFAIRGAVAEYTPLYFPPSGVVGNFKVLLVNVRCDRKASVPITFPTEMPHLCFKSFNLSQKSVPLSDGFIIGIINHNTQRMLR